MRLSFLMVAVVVLTAGPAAAQSTIDPDARVVELRASCISQGSTYLDNCFEATADLTDWLWVDAGTPSGRSSEPNSLDGVTVRVGPGVFDRFECVGTAGAMRGWVSVAGAGTDLTVFEPSDPLVSDPDLGPSVCVGGIDLKNCTGMSFQDLKARGQTRGANWHGSGDSVWRDVDFVADPGNAPSGTLCTNEGAAVPVYAWYDRFEFPAPTAEHFFWDSRFIVRNPETGSSYGRVAFATNDDDNWFYGCDFLTDLSNAVVGQTPTGFLNSGLNVNFKAAARLFGSTVRVRVENGTLTGRVTGVQLSGQDAVFHMHGGIINVNIKATDVDVAGIDVLLGKIVHTPEAAFNLRPSGTKTTWRIRSPGSADIQSPFQWPASDTAPDIQSVHGQDTFVKTDAGPGGDETRLYIYDDSCASQWRDAGGTGCL